MTLNEQPDSAHRVLQQPFTLGSWTVQPMLNRIELIESDCGREPPTPTLVRNLEPRLMQLLCFLANRSEQVSTREELVKALWPRVIVNENSLTRAVSELRKQLSTAEVAGSSYIETIPKKGYRLTPAVIGGLPPLETEPRRAALIADTGNRDGSSRGIGKGSFAAAGAAGPLAALRSNWSMVASSASLSLVLGLWAWQLVPGSTESPADTPQLFADQVIDPVEPWIAAELTMSSDSSGIFSDKRMLSGPVFSDDSKTFAYIQCNNEGATIFIGSSQQHAQGQMGEIGSDLTEAPAIAVFSSSDMLENLRWSPLGNALLFARPSKLSKAALYSGTSALAPPGSELVMLDLDTLETRVLYRIEPEDSDEMSDAMSLT